MPSHQTIACLAALVFAALGAADEPPVAVRVGPHVPSAATPLREASKLARAQGEHQHYWTGGAMLQIARLQVQLGEYDDALQSVEEVDDIYRKSISTDLARSIARRGDRQRAFEILRSLRLDRDGFPDQGEDSVQLGWIEHLIASGEFARARKAAEAIKTPRYRPDGWRTLAVGFARSGDPVRAAEWFERSIEAAGSIRDESDRAAAVSRTAAAQQSVRMVEAARATLQRLVNTGMPRDEWDRIGVLRECAVIAARAGDDALARRLFQQALEPPKNFAPEDRLRVFAAVATSQADAGYLDDAAKVIALIKQHANGDSTDFSCEEARYTVAVAQVNAGDVDGAERTVASFRRNHFFRDQVYQLMVDRAIASHRLAAAAATAAKIDERSRRAASVLKIATAHARAGDYGEALAVAAAIKLERESPLNRFEATRFRYHQPQTWGHLYSMPPAVFSMGLHMYAAERAAEVMAAAMRLSLALRQKPAESYAVLFDTIYTEEVVRAAARAHSVYGDPNEALAWARRIGRGGTAAANDDDHARAVRRRVSSLVGVAEGLRERPLIATGR